MQKALSFSLRYVLGADQIRRGDELDVQGTVTQVAAPEGAYAYNALK